MEKHECVRAVGHTIFMIFFFYSMYLCVCGVLANKSFRLFFICLKHHYSAHYRIENVFRGGLNLATFRIFLRLVFVGMCVCVWYVFGIGFLVLFVLFLLVSWFERPQNFKFFQGRVTMALLC